jgi:hypothetical protein
LAASYVSTRIFSVCCAASDRVLVSRGLACRSGGYPLFGVASNNS